MALAASPSRSQLWLDAGDWRWPGGQGAEAAERFPPEWVPATPPLAPREQSLPAREAPRTREAPRVGSARTMPALLLAALAVLGAALAVHPRLAARQLPTGGAAAGSGDPGTFLAHPGRALAPLPALTPVSRAASGSAIEHVSFQSVSVRGRGGFLVYLPPGYTAAHRYPVLYLLHGNEQLAVEFLLQGDLQSELDRLIAAGRVPPMIAIMPEGGKGAINWRNVDANRWESYVLEIQELVDGMLPTIRNRQARALAGDSMGAYGAMEVALDNLSRFATAASWLGFFNGLAPQLETDRPMIRQLGFHAWVYGGAQDHIANPDEDLPWAEALRAAGAEAHGAIYQGEHNMHTVLAHMQGQLEFIGAQLRRGEHPAGAAHAQHAATAAHAQHAAGAAQ